MSNRFQNLAQRHSAVLAHGTPVISVAGEHLFQALVAYGKVSDAEHIQSVQEAYAAALEMTEPASRFAFWPRLAELLEADQINPNPLLAMAICDPHQAIAATAALDFVCFSEDVPGGLPFGVMEFSRLLRTSGILANKGAVFGGLLALGDTSLQEFYRAMTPHIPRSELEVAAHCSLSGRAFDATIDYWLWILELLIESADHEDQSLVGAAGAHLVRTYKECEGDLIHRATRKYPSYRHEPPIVVHQTWPKWVYAGGARERFQAICMREPPPQIMPAIMREWSMN